jgi:glutamate 5-kinase
MLNNINVIKIGTNVITNNQGFIDLQIIQNITKQVAQIQSQEEKIVIVSSGAVGAGKEICPELKEEKDKFLRKRMLAAVGQARLIQIYNDFFKQKNITIAQILVQRRNITERESYIEFRETLYGLLKRNIIPIINENDVTTPLSWQFGENDYLAALLAVALKASRLILCTDVDGLYTDDPRLNKSAKRLSEITNITENMQNMAKKSSSGVGSGGMMSKIQAVKLATEAAVPAYIINGKKKNNILSIFNSTNQGTKFIPKIRNLKTYQRWLAAGAHTYGQVIIDEGAVTALKKRKSLLMVGIKNATSDFKKGDIVDIVDLNSNLIAVGMINYSRRQIKLHLQKEKKSNLKEVVHCDNLVLM